MKCNEATTMKRRQVAKMAAISWLTAFAMTANLTAALKLPAVISDHMVLQAGQPVPIWGWADEGTNITVSFAGQKKATTVPASGKWMVKLDALTANGTPAVMTISSSVRSETAHQLVTDVLVGEVWLGSGQSNMAFKVSAAKDFEKEKAAAELPQLRCFTTTAQYSEKPAQDCKGEWKVCSAETVGTFSATAFFFGREIHREMKTPVGLVVSAVGGTPIDSWVDGDKQRALPEMKAFFTAKEAAPAADPEKERAAYQAAVKKWQEDVKTARADKKPLPVKPRDPTEMRAKKSNLGGLFNGMIMPLVPYAIRGALWYQGEANTVPEKAAFYQYQLPLLVTDWRARWGDEFPFAWVQLPNFAGTGRDLPQVREGMMKTLRLPKTGMAITIDIGETGNIHPKNKQEVGRRLAQWALATVYDRAGVESSGPLFSKAEPRGGEMVVHFTHARGLTAKDGAPAGFQIAGEDQQWHAAQAKIVGETVVVSSPDVPKPSAVRYAWENDPKSNLYNEAGIPASPFRSDDWKIEPPADQKPVRTRRQAR